jgi:hypothetical protein
VNITIPDGVSIERVDDPDRPLTHGPREVTFKVFILGDEGDFGEHLTHVQVLYRMRAGEWYVHIAPVSHTYEVVEARGLAAAIEMAADIVEERNRAS